MERIKVNNFIIVLFYIKNYLDKLGFDENRGFKKNIVQKIPEKLFSHSHHRLCSKTELIR